MSDKQDEGRDSTAARVALWRALHAEIDPPPHVLKDEIGLRLLAPTPIGVVAQRYFDGRTDGLRPPNNAEELLVAIS